MNSRSVKLPVRLAAILGGALLLAVMLSGQASAAGPAPGVGLLVNNYWGGPATLTIAFTQNTIPAYGQGFIALAPGVYDLSVNVDGNDRSAMDAQVTIPDGQAVQMSYSVHGIFFETVAIAQPTATPEATAAGAPNTDPGSAAALDTQWHSIDANQSLWYRFELFSRNEDVFALAIPLGVPNGMRFEVYSSDQISDWWAEAPRGIGNEDGDSLTWGVTADGSSVWYVRVINTRPQSGGFQFTFNGPIVTQ